MLAHEAVDDLLRRPPSLILSQHLSMKRRTVAAREVGRAARVDIESTAAGAAQPLFDCLDRHEVVFGRDRVGRPPGPVRLEQAARRQTVRLLDGRTDGQKQPACEEPKELPAVTVRPSDRPTVRHHSPTRRTAYPACVRLTAGDPPPGHMTIRPPSATIMPPYHTHHTSGLIVKRYTACSVPFTTPASTVYRSSRRSLRMPTAVDGSNVGRPLASTCWRFAVASSPIFLPLRATSTVAAVTRRLRAWYCETPRWVKVYVQP